MSHQIVLTPENGGVRIQTMFEMGVDGKVEISMVIPNADLGMSAIEMQAIACEHIAEALSHRAASFRRQLPGNAATVEPLR